MDCVHDESDKWEWTKTLYSMDAILLFSSIFIHSFEIIWTKLNSDMKNRKYAHHDVLFFFFYP